MNKPTDVRVTGVSLYFLPVTDAGSIEVWDRNLDIGDVCPGECDCCRSHGHTAEGWGETPLSVQWVWPSQLPYAAAP